MAARLRSIAETYVANGPTGVSVRTRLKGMTLSDERVLREVGAHLGRLASSDLAARVRDGLDHDKHSWADRKRAVTAVSSARWAGSITKFSNDQWSLARRNQLAQLRNLAAGIEMLSYRLSLGLGEKGVAGKPGGYQSAQEWFAKSRRLAALRARCAQLQANWDSGRISVVRGGRKLLHHRHHLGRAGLSEEQWRARWEAERWFFAADGESGKKFGNETVRVTPDGEVSIRLPAPLEHLANARNGRYVLTAIARFQHRGAEWAERIAGDRAVAYRFHYDATRDRWYVGASWQRSPTRPVSLAVLRSGPVIGVDTNVDHLAAWKLDPHGNPTGRPKTFGYDLSGTADHRDAQLRHALSQLLRWARSEGVRAIAVEDLDFGDSTTREKHGRRKRFRQLISGMPTGKLRSRLVSMAAETGASVIVVDPAYTSRWGNEHWRAPLSRKKHEITRHHAASLVIGRRALGHGIRRRGTPPRHDQSDRVGHRTIQARPRTRGCEGTRPDATGTRTRSVLSGRRANAGTQFVQHRSGWTQ